MSTAQSQNGTQLKKAVPYLSMVLLGLGGIWGTSWLVLAPSWIGKGGGLFAALLAWVLIAIIEIPLVMAYVKAIPLFPKAEGELSYARAAFGKGVGFWAAWFGILVNLIICAYEVVALFRMVGFLWPGMSETTSWYEIYGSKVGPVMIVLGMALVLGITIMHLRGVSISSKVTSVITSILITLVTIGVILALVFGDFSNLIPPATWDADFGKSLLPGMIAVATLLPFSFAGWESVAKGAEEAADHKSAGKAILVAWIAGWTAYVLSLVATGLVMNWEPGATGKPLAEVLPFASGLGRLTGVELAGQVLVFTALLGTIGVYNVLFYAVTRQLFGMARAGLLPRYFAKLDKNQVPRRAILLMTAILMISPFLGSGVLLELVLAASFAYIVLWGLTLFSIIVLGRRWKGTKREFKPLHPVFQVLGVVSVVFMLVVLVLPASPGALVWPGQYLILLALIAVGIVLYVFARRESDPEEASDVEDPAEVSS